MCPTDYVVRRADRGDAEALAPSLREADRREIAAATGEPPPLALARSVGASDPAWAVVDPSGAVVALFGAAPDRGDIGIAWCLGSDALVGAPLLFLRYASRWIDRLHERYRTLWNVVDARNHEHVRWLSWCGFSHLGTIDEYGVERRPFHRFGRLRHAARPSNGAPA